jgi:carbon starvation protein
MLIEGVLATIAIITAAYIGADKFAALADAGGPNNVFSDGIGNFMTSFGVPFEIGKSFVALAVSAFALTSLDTGTRLGRFILEEFFYDASKEKQNPLSNRYVSTLVTVVLGGWLALTGWSVIWPIFGSANQLLAGLALLSVAVWLKKSGKNYSMFTIPMTFMLIVTVLALLQLIQTNMAAQNYILVVFPILLLALAVVLAVQGYKIIAGKEEAPLEK